MIALSWKDETGLKSPMKSFPSINLHMRICLFESKDRIVLRREPGFPWRTRNDTDLFGTRL